MLVLSIILAALPLASERQQSAHAQSATRHAITWDSHSLLIDGKRVLIYSGEFHYFRLPSRAGWVDRLEKMKAAGLNAVSIYFDWGYHSFAPGQYDFSGARDIEYLLRIADRLGLYVIARVGPYMNAEVDAGGLPGWVLTKPLFPRSQAWDGKKARPQYSALYSQYSREWYDHLLPILARHQATDGKSVLLMSIENEYDQTTGSDQYMHDLYGYARADGITVPIFHNDYWFRGDWRNVVDLYGYDSYPYGFQCCHQWYDIHFHGVDTWESHLRNDLHVTQTPMFVSELQGGAFQPWGGQSYDQVAQTFDDGWLTALDQSALAQGTTMLNTYMFAGGTTWGYMSEPGVFSSYDYGAPISEAGQLRPAYYAAHRLGMFLDSFGPSLAGADANSAFATADNPKVVVHARTNSQSGQNFVFLRHGDPGQPELTHLKIQVAGHDVVIPQRPGTAIAVPGHDGELLTANVDVGSLHMNYSTSQVLTSASTDQGQYLILYGPDGTSGETDFVDPGANVQVDHNLGVAVSRKNGELRLNYRHDNHVRTASIQTPQGTVRLVILSTEQASHTWLSHHLIITGPDLITDNARAQPRLSINTSADVRVYGTTSQTQLFVDGRVPSMPDAYMGSVDLGGLGGAPVLRLPQLNTWKFSPEATEISPSFDDSGWQDANRPSSNPNLPSPSTTVADDYGFHYGYVWYRGHFIATGNETGITINARQSYSVYLNGTFLGSGNASLDDPPHAYTTPVTFAFPEGAVRVQQANVISVLTENLGHDEGWLAGPAAQSPQGLLNAQLNGSPAPLTWKIQGAQGGETASDSKRGLFNASGLYGERQGWYQPAYNDSRWPQVSLPDSWTARGVSQPVGWYRSRFGLQTPSDARVSLGLTLPAVGDKATIWLNGWLIGRYWEQRGPQHTFYLPQGILKTRGENVLAIAVWNRGADGGLNSRPLLMNYGSQQLHSLQIRRSLSAPPAGFWHTSGNRIVDQAQHPVRIAAVNWGGMQNRYYVPAGLDVTKLSDLMLRIRTMGFNTIRLPFSDEMVEHNPVVTQHLQANPDLHGLHSLDILDRIVRAAADQNLRVILENHRSTAGADPQENGLWYSDGYPESAWIRDWQQLARRYRNNPTVVGADLRDEPHTGPPGPWSVNTYLRQGATWGAYGGHENPATDWRLAAQRGGNAVLGANPHLLIFVEGIQQYPDQTQPGGLDSYWWGGLLTPAAQFPIQLAVPHQLVYSPHEYGPVKYRMPFFNAHTSYATLANLWEKHWGFLDSAARGQGVPIFIGEFGTCGQSINCVRDAQPGTQGQWFDLWMQFLEQHTEIGWGFWALNGTNTDGHDQPNYLLRPDWHSIRLHALIDRLRDVEAGPSP